MDEAEYQEPEQLVINCNYPGCCMPGAHFPSECHSAEDIIAMMEAPEPPVCPRCENNRQVWENQITGKLMCHRVGCYIEISPNVQDEPRP